MADKDKVALPDASLSPAAFAAKYGKRGNNESYMRAQLERVAGGNFSAFLDEFAPSQGARARMENDLPEASGAA